jgi:DNA-binding transcriptional MerR regulator
VVTKISAVTVDEGLLTVDELSQRVGMTVRTLRFYASRGLMPPPVRRGRVGYYGAEHVARLDLVRELQAHGFTLSAIEGYLDRIPADASPQDIALHRTLLAPWMRDLPETLDRPALVERAGRQLSDDDIEMLVALGVVEPTPEDDVFRVATAHLGLGVELIDLDLPLEAVRAAGRIFTEHGRAMAEELTELFRTTVWPHYRERGEPPEHVQQLVERFKPVTIQGLVLAYERAVSETQRDTIRRRQTRPARTGSAPPAGD